MANQIPEELTRLKMFTLLWVEHIHGVMHWCRLLLELTLVCNICMR